MDKRLVWSQEVTDDGRIILKKTGTTVIGLINKKDVPMARSHKWLALIDKRYSRLYTGTPKGMRPISHFILPECPKGYVRDHKNGNTLDDRRRNLRIIPAGMNQMNSKLCKTNKSGYKGVSKNGKWYDPVISVNYKTIHLGMCKTPKEAAKKYDKAAIKYFGKCARTNKMLGLLS